MPIKPFTIGYLALLLFFSSLIFDTYDRLWQSAAIIILYAMFDIVWTYARNRVWYIPSSSLISGFILALVGTVTGGVMSIFAVPFVAVFSKHVIRFGAPRHIFNPAAFSLAVFSFLGVLHPSLNIFAPTWWAPSLASPIIFILVLFAGAFIVFRLKRWHIVFSFLIVYSIFWMLLFWSYHSVEESMSKILWQHILDSTLVFFISVMLIEPITSSFPLRWQRMFYGALVAAFAGLLSYGAGSAAGVWFSWLDPLIGGLILGNLIAGLRQLSLVNKASQVVFHKSLPPKS